MRRLPPLNSLRAFEATARLQGVQRASEELHVTHGAISRQLKQLEAWLGVTLFDRSARNISVNSAGENYLKTISSALDLIAQGSENLQHLKTENTLGIATTHSIASKWLMDKLNLFSQISAETEVWLSLEQRSTDFGATGIDLAIRMGHGPWPDLHCLPLLQDRLIPVCSPTLLSQECRLEKPADLAKFTLLHDRDPETQWQSWFTANQLELIDITKGPRYTSSDILLNSAINGQGVALVSEVLATADLAQQRLLQPLPQSVDLGVYFWLVMPREKYQQPQVRRFCDWLLANVKG
ncbi:MAG: transcriptional regulator GcvA [Pseudomonadales bacterium]|nr:transcriptional regulator GcvA [Pseudomonadales bacterium]NRA15396.1 transcriptional regulator GcvA [Oceanospirillaceae bacterium]